MPLFLITGTSGTGKSEICKALKSSRYEAYDIDDDGLARWQNMKTGYIHPKSSVKAAQRTSKFLEEHSWNVPREILEDLTKISGKKNIYICGSIGNEEKVRDLFKKIFALHVDDKTLINRLKNRVNNDWGKQPHELEITLDNHHKDYDKYRKHGDIIIDDTRPIEEIMQDIIHISE